MNQNPSVAQIPPTNSDRLLTKKAAAKRLSISIRTLDRLIKEGLLELEERMVEIFARKNGANA